MYLSFFSYQGLKRVFLPVGPPRNAVYFHLRSDFKRARAFLAADDFGNFLVAVR